MRMLFGYLVMRLSFSNGLTQITKGPKARSTTAEIEASTQKRSVAAELGNPKCQPPAWTACL